MTGIVPTQSPQPAPGELPSATGDADDARPLNGASARWDPSSEEVLRAGLAGAGSLALAGLVANGANVFTTFALSHFLTSRGYGAFNLLVYVFLVLSMPGYAVVVAVVRQVTRWEAEGHPERSVQWARRLRTGCVGVVAAVLAASLAAGPALARSFSLPDASGMAPILTAGAMWLLLSVDRGLLQAHRHYKSMARNLVVEGAVRTLGMLGLVAGGLGVRGAMLAILSSAVAADLDARLSLAAYSKRARPTGIARPGLARREGEDGDQKEPPAWLAEELSIATAGEAPMPSGPARRAVGDFLAALASLALLASLAGLDVIVVGKMDPHGAGAYAAVAVVSKVLFFAALVLSGYLLPEATTRWHHGENAYRQLAITLCFLAAGAAVGEVVALAGARSALGVVFPRRLLADSGDVSVLIAAMALLAASVVLTYYLLGTGRRAVVWILLGGTALLAALLVAGGGSPARTVRADAIAQAVLLFCLASYLASARKPFAGESSPDRVA
jgi:hypothetical protein